MISSTNKFACRRNDDETLTLIVNNEAVSSRLIGRGIEAQYVIGDKYLLILQADQTKIIAYVLNADLQVIDEQVIGHWYFDSLFGDTKIIQPDTVQLTFGTTGTIKISDEPIRNGLFEKKRYLTCSGLPIEI